MSILATQNINKFDELTPGDRIKDKWNDNLGQKTLDAAPQTGFGGFTYNAQGLATFNRSTLGKDHTGPQNNELLPMRSEYGPMGYARVSDTSTGTTLLGAFAAMIGQIDVAGWGATKPAVRMSQTFATGKQMRSLRDSTNASSGGRRSGYSEQTPYEITNWKSDASGVTPPKTQQLQVGQEEVQSPVDSAFDHTGIRNIAGMRTFLPQQIN